MTSFWEKCCYLLLCLSLIKPTSFHWFYRKEGRAVIKKLVGFKPRSMGNPLWCFTPCNLSQLNQNLLFFYRGAHLQVMSENIFCFFSKNPQNLLFATKFLIGFSPLRGRTHQEWERKPSFRFFKFSISTRKLLESNSSTGSLLIDQF